MHVGIGGGSATNTGTTHDDVAYGSQITSAGNVTIAATNGDLNIVGSQVTGQNVALAASNNINLLSQAEQHTQSNDSHNASGEVGLSIGQTTGIYLTASAGEALAHGNGTTHDDSVVSAANTLSLVSGNDTTIQGAQATGNSVLANIGGNLDIASEQDTGDYASHSIQAGITVVYGESNGGVGVSGSLALSKANSHYASVTQMSGIGAGSGGFDIAVGGNTDLKGAAIASTADPSKNLLNTGSLTTSSIENVSQSSAESLSVGGGVGSGQMSGMSGLSGGIGIPQNSDQHSTTQAGIAQGTIVVGGNANPNLSGLDRDPSLSNANGLTNTFNPQQVAQNQQVGQLAGQVGMAAAGDLESNLNLAPGSAGSVAIHTAVGAAVAALGDGNALHGALGAGAGEAATPYLQSLGPDGELAGTTLIGALVGGGAGASTALAGTEYNYLSHPQIQAVTQACQGGDTSACQQAVSTAQGQSQANDMQMELDCAGSGGSQACQQDLSALMSFLDEPLSSSLTAMQQGDQGLLEGGYFFSGPPGVPVGTPNALSLADSAGQGIASGSSDTSTLAAPTLGSVGGFFSGVAQGAVGAVAPYMDQYEGPNPNNPFVPYQAGSNNTPTSMTGQSAAVQQGYAAGQVIGGALLAEGGDAVMGPVATTTSVDTSATADPGAANPANAADLAAVNVTATAGSAADMTTAAQLRTQLALQEAGYLDANGQLTPQAIQSSTFIPLKTAIQNPAVVSVLTSDGSDIADWGKYTTPAVTLPNGQSLQIHYYMNSVTGEVDYLTPDYKVKGVVQQ